MKRKDFLYLVGDFETTVYDGQTSTEVWASAITAVGNTDPEKVVVLHSLPETMEYLFKLKQDIIIYYHNLKFDGSFILDYLCRQKKFKLWSDGKKLVKTPKGKFDLPSGFWTYTVSDMGVWYGIAIAYKGKIIEFRDSYKILPFSVEKIGHDFDTQHRKKTMEYKGKRYAGCEISPSEEEYIKSDVLVMSEAIAIARKEGITGVTIGSTCLAEWKRLRYGIGKRDEIDYMFRMDFPILPDDIERDIRRGYKGGWCYVNKYGKFTNGMTADINSSYPYQMHGRSGQYYPIGYPERIDKIGKNVSRETIEFYVVKFSFSLKSGKLPCIQIKGDPRFDGTEWLKESGQTLGCDNVVEMVFSDIEWAFIKDHYHIENFQFIRGYRFKAVRGLFDTYIDKWMKVKQTSTGARRAIAKLMLNNLYGKFAASDISDYKYFYIGKRDSLSSYVVEERQQEPGFIPIGGMITAYARMYVIRAAEKNFETFCYCDTDSIHCAGKIEGIPIHESDLGAWKIESEWDAGFFSGQKRYIERVGEKYILRCAGLGKETKANFINGLKSGKFTIEDFKSGLELEGNLKAHIITGGTVLEEKTFKMR